MSTIDTYSCPVDGCDYEIFAVGLQDPDEPDYFTEDIEQHKRGHVVESQHIDSATHASSSQAGLASLIPSGGAVTQPNPAPSDDTTPSLVELDRREAAAAAEPFSVEGMHIVSGWLVEPVNECTCGGADQYGHAAHERGCGLEPVARLDDLPGWPGERAARPTTAEAVVAIKKRLGWASMHWGTEKVHEDAWTHIADAVLNLWDTEANR